MAEILTDNQPAPDSILDLAQTLAEGANESDEIILPNEEKKVVEKEVKEPKEDKVVEDDEDEKEEKEGLELPEEDTTEEELQKLTYQDVPRRQVILKEYPDLFKKFPSIEGALYREQKYAEIFPTLDDAKEAVERIGEYKKLEETVSNGSLREILTKVRDTNPEAFGKIKGDYLNILKDVDPNAHYDTIVYILRNAIVGAAVNGSQNKNETLIAAARLMNKFIFGTDRFEDYPQNPNQQQVQNPVDNKLSEREKALQERENNLKQQALTENVTKVNTGIETSVKSAVEKYIDPRNQMQPYVKDKAISDALVEIDKMMKSDTRFVSVMNRLWTRAINEEYSPASLSEVKKALRTKAQSVLGDAIRKTRANALRGVAASIRNENEPRNEKPIAQGRPASTRSSNEGNKQREGKKDPSQMSTLEFLSQD